MSQTINVSVLPGLGLLQPTLYYSQNDVGREFVINVPDFDLTGATVTIQATKPSGLGFTVAGTVSGNAVTFTTTEGMTDESGIFPAELHIESNGVEIGTANFLMRGEENPHPEGTIDGQKGSILPQLTLLVTRIETAAESIHELTVDATTRAIGTGATAEYDSTTNKITFGIPSGGELYATDEDSDGNVVITFS